MTRNDVTIVSLADWQWTAFIFLDTNLKKYSEGQVNSTMTFLAIWVEKP